MLDLGWSELLIIAIGALIVVGPKDLPRMLRTLGQYAARAKRVAREFQRSMDEAARQADLDELRDVKKDLDSVRESQYQMQREMSQSFLDEGKASSKKKAQAKTGEAKSDGAAQPEPAQADSTQSGSAQPDEAGAPDEAPVSRAKEAPAAGAAPSSEPEPEPEPEPEHERSAGKAGGA